jgi:serine/threonine-protein kinase
MQAGMQVGAYRLLEELGAGGMGAVWLANHEKLGRRAAIKVLHATFASRPDIVTRFFNEARAATAIRDPGIVQIYDFGHHDGLAFIVMELLDGTPLDKRLRERGGVLALGEALRITRQVASTLGACHATGIVHRDLKPENIFLVRDPEVFGGERAKVLDFGIAKLVSVDEVGVKTQTAALMGTPHYMSPEQCRGAGLVDARSDVYSLGCVLFVLLTGRPPFQAEGVGDILAMHLREDAPSLASILPGAPPEIVRLVARCLAKTADERYANGRELAVALDALLADPAIASASASAVPVAARDVPESPATTLSSLAHSTASGTKKGSRTTARIGIAIGAVTLAGGAIAVLAWPRDDVNPLSNPSSNSSPPPTPPSGPPPTPAVVEPTPKPAPAPTSEQRIATAIDAFDAWAKGHAKAPCPTPGDLGVPDARLRITCTEQPATQIIGIIDAGSDGAFGTTDDVRSWTLDAVAGRLRGARWSSSKQVAIPRPVKPPAGSATPPAKDPPKDPPKDPIPPPKNPPPSSTLIDLDGDGIPDKR